MHLLHGGMRAIVEDSCAGDNRHVADSLAHPDILYPVQLQLHCVRATHTTTEKVISKNHFRHSESLHIRSLGFLPIPLFVWLLLSFCFLLIK